MSELSMYGCTVKEYNKCIKKNPEWYFFACDSCEKSNHYKKKQKGKKG